MIVDYLRSCYTARFRPYAGSEQEGIITWFRAAPGARPFPGPNAWASNVWEDQIGYQKEGIGEVDFTRMWSRCTNPGLAGTHFDGPAAWFVDGVPQANAADPPSPCNLVFPYARADLAVSAHDLLTPDVWFATADLAVSAADNFPSRADLAVDASGYPAPDVWFANADLAVEATEDSPMPFSGARAVESSQTLDIPDTITLGWDSVEYDTDGYFDLGSDSTRITVPSDGIYLVGGRVLFNGAYSTSGETDFAVGFSVSGVATLDGVSGQWLHQPGFTSVTLTFAAELELSAGDYLQFGVTSNGDDTGTVTLDSAVWIDFRGPLP
jgi:hypothetical protein